jgi:molecular chaperone GrpE
MTEDVTDNGAEPGEDWLRQHDRGGGADQDAAEMFDPAAELERLAAENAALKEQALRYAADAENTRRRAEREANDARAFAIQRFARDLLDASDNLARAVAHAPKDNADTVVKNFVLGVEMTEKALQSAFERNGVKRVDPARGDRFDPHLHQAMMEQPAADVAPGSVLSVMQVGYELFGRILRPALVAVSAKGAAAADASGAYAAPAADATGGELDTKA